MLTCENNIMHHIFSSFFENSWICIYWTYSCPVVDQRTHFTSREDMRQKWKASQLVMMTNILIHNFNSISNSAKLLSQANKSLHIKQSKETSWEGPVKIITIIGPTKKLMGTLCGRLISDNFICRIFLPLNCVWLWSERKLVFLYGRELIWFRI